MFNFIGSIIFITFMGLFIKLVLAISPADDIARQIANAHTAFNVVNTLLFMPFTGLYIKFIEKCLPGKGEIISRKPAYLDEKMLVTPSIAMGLAVKEIVRMGNMARHNVEVGMQALEDKDENKIKYVLEHEPVIDALEEDITRYLTKMSEKEMGAELSAMHTSCCTPARILNVSATTAKRLPKMHAACLKTMLNSAKKPKPNCALWANWLCRPAAKPWKRLPITIRCWHRKRGIFAVS